jgi:hypothetical protein
VRTRPTSWGRFSLRRQPGSSSDRAHLPDTSKQVGDPDHLKVFTNADAAEKWFEENDPEGVAFEYKVIQPSA